jgi:hypothetical protein
MSNRGDGSSRAFNEVIAKRTQRNLYDDFRGAFAAMPAEMKDEAVDRFTQEFSHEHRNPKFKLVKEIMQ